MGEESFIDPGTGSNTLPATTPSGGFNWAALSSWGAGAASSAWGSFSTGAGMSAYGYGAEALANLAQGLLAAKRAKRIAEYNADITAANAEAQANAAEIEAQQYQRRAALARRELAEAEVIATQAHAYREERQREQNARILGQTRAIVASSGLMMSGSPLAVYEETARQQQLDLLATRYQTQLQLRQQRAATEEQITQDAYAAQLARYGAGERLRVGRAQGGLLRGEADTSGTMAGLLKASASLTKGAAVYQNLEERRTQPTLLKE
jgi:hypothetical protein